MCESMCRADQSDSAFHVSPPRRRERGEGNPVATDPLPRPVGAAAQQCNESAANPMILNQRGARHPKGCDVTDHKLERLEPAFGPSTSTGRVREVVVHFSVDRGISERSSGRVQDRPTSRVGHGPYCEW
jgi:hypothetical protein